MIKNTAKIPNKIFVFFPIKICYILSEGLCYTQTALGLLLIERILLSGLAIIFRDIPNPGEKRPFVILAPPEKVEENHYA